MGDACKAARQKPSQVKVKVGGDAGCDGKNQWDDNIQSLVPQMLNLNSIHYDQYNVDDLKKLRLALDNEFEYLDNELSK